VGRRVAEENRWAAEVEGRDVDVPGWQRRRPAGQGRPKQEFSWRWRILRREASEDGGGRRGGGDRMGGR